MRVGHFDAGFGIAGDMALAALIDAGAPGEAVDAALAGTGVSGLRAERTPVQRAGLRCLSLSVRWDREGETAGAPRPGHPPAHAHEHDQEHAHGHDHSHDHAPGHAHGHPHRPYREIQALLAAAPLTPGTRWRAEAVFARLAKAEAAVHGAAVETVLLHEVGGEDAIGDIVGVAAALDALGIERLTASPLPAGGGTVRAAHGTLPVPAPAVALLLEGWPFVPGPVNAELVTPTGAAILAALAEPSERWPAMRLHGGGWGAGKRDFAHHPNACRFVWGEAGGAQVEPLFELETHLDDQTPEQVAYCCTQLFAAGALDVATSPVQMKKGRAGVRVWALVRPAALDAARACLFAESTALGVRVRPVDRWSLERRAEPVRTPFGTITVKVGWEGGRVRNAAPEYEECAEAARRHGVPLKEVMAAALAAWRNGAPADQA